MRSSRCSPPPSFMAKTLLPWAESRVFSIFAYMDRICTYYFPWFWCVMNLYAFRFSNYFRLMLVFLLCLFDLQKLHDAASVALAYLYHLCVCFYHISSSQWLHWEQIKLSVVFLCLLYGVRLHFTSGLRQVLVHLNLKFLWTNTCRNNHDML